MTGGKKQGTEDKWKRAEQKPTTQKQERGQNGKRERPKKRWPVEAEGPDETVEGRNDHAVGKVDLLRTGEPEAPYGTGKLNNHKAKAAKASNLLQCFQQLIPGAVKASG